MSKEELIQELSDISSSFVNDINAKLTDLSEKFSDMIKNVGCVNLCLLFLKGCCNLSPI